MKGEMTCIVCPIGCSLVVEAEEKEEPRVTGNRCPRGAAYAVEELRAPKRMVTATCRLLPADPSCDDAATAAEAREPTTMEGRDARERARILFALPPDGLCEPRRLPVKTSVPCPKERIEELLSDIYGVSARIPVRRGDVLIADWKGTGIDVLSARTVL